MMRRCDERYVMNSAPTFASNESTTVIERTPLAGGIYRTTAQGGCPLALVDDATPGRSGVRAMAAAAPVVSSDPPPARFPFVFAPLLLPPPLPLPLLLPLPVPAGAGQAMMRCPESSRNCALSSSAKFCSSVMSSSSSIKPLQSMSNWARYCRHCFNE